MNITLNGKPKKIDPAMTLRNLVEQFCGNTNHVIVELNGTIIKNERWASQEVEDGDTLELVNLVGGG